MMGWTFELGRALEMNNGWRLVYPMSIPMSWTHILELSRSLPGIPYLFYCNQNMIRAREIAISRNRYLTLPPVPIHNGTLKPAPININYCT